MNFEEIPSYFDCDGEQLVGIATVPEDVTTDTGLLVIVGGPQYRVGSHRQFVLLCRALARQGIPGMRFDCRGMGDATGTERRFDELEDDIRAAVDEFTRRVPTIEKVVLWGLCDGASAACFYAPTDDRISGLVLLNPWVRTEAGEAKTYVKHYYAKRVISPDFWRKLLGGKLDVGGSIKELLAKIRLSGTAQTGADAGDLPTRMAAALQKSALPALFILSGRDYVANEFEIAVQSHETWSRLLESADLVRFADADHTFSNAKGRAAVEEATIDWLKALASPGRA